MAKLITMLKEYKGEMPNGATLTLRKGSRQKFRDDNFTKKLLSEGYAEETKPPKKKDSKKLKPSESKKAEAKKPEDKGESKGE